MKLWINTLTGWTLCLQYKSSNISDNLIKFKSTRTTYTLFFKLVSNTVRNSHQKDTLINENLLLNLVVNWLRHCPRKLSS